MNQNLRLNMTAEFNTGRHYSPEGQTIQATVVGLEPCSILPEFDLAVVEFVDLTRRISGTVKVYAPATPRAVLAAYDAGHYELT